MKTFMLLFRLDILTKESQPTESQMHQYLKQWNEWIDSIVARGQLAAGGNHLQSSGKVVRPGGSVRDTPYAANLESIAGYILITAASLDDAAAIAKQCPILHGGEKNSVEVREIASLPG